MTGGKRVTGSGDGKATGSEGVETDYGPLMTRALELARTAARLGEVPVGAVLARGDEILAEAHNRVVSDHDPTAHAEMLVLRAGARILGNERLTGTVLVTTLEPCAMCAGAAVLARVDRLVFGARDPRTGAAGSIFDITSSPALNHRIEVIGGVEAEAAARLLRDFFKERRRGAGAVERARLEIE